MTLEWSSENNKLMAVISMHKQLFD
jgi:hypothetical protein